MSENSNFTILIVDDNAHNRFSLKTLLLRHLNVRILEASSGMEALELAMQHDQIDIIILDVQMPEMDGFKTASMLKIRKKTRDIPVIFLTAAFKSDEFQRRGYEVGGVDYLLKPIEDNQLINKVSTYIRLIETEREMNWRLEEQVRQRTEELRQAKQYLENLIKFMGEALIVLTPQGAITSVNPAAARMLDYAEKDLIGMSIGEVFEEQDQQQAIAFMGTWVEALIRSGVIPNIEASFIAKTGERVPVLFSRSAMYDSAGNISAIICIAKDMREYKRVERALQECEDD